MNWIVRTFSLQRSETVALVSKHSPRKYGGLLVTETFHLPNCDVQTFHCPYEPKFMTVERAITQVCNEGRKLIWDILRCVGGLDSILYHATKQSFLLTDQARALPNCSDVWYTIVWQIHIAELSLVDSDVCFNLTLFFLNGTS